jgi:hypothetical protein
VRGLSFGIGGNDSVMDCEIKFNGTGVWVNSNTLITHCDIENDTIGIIVNNPAANIYCNKICNNVSYGLQLTTSANFNVADNFWCTTDSAQVAAAIYDGYDNVSFGLVTFLPVDSTCYVTTSINEIENNSLLTVYPNPVSSQAIIHSANFFKDASLIVYNSFGQKVKQINHISGRTVTFFRDNLESGLYFIRLMEDDKILATNKLVISD